MGKIAFVFPGQGSQKVGMGKDVYEAHAKARSVFEAADDALGERLSTLCFEGPEDALKLTANTQPAILTTSIALYEALDTTCDVAAGHSLGEYSAHVAAGTLRFGDAVRIVRVRGQYMQDAVPLGKGAMAAILGLDASVVDEVCAGIEGVAEPVNYNSPGQVVIAGERDAIERACEALKTRGGKAMLLPVSAPFHSSMMKPAEERLSPHLLSTTFESPRVPVYVNVDAAPVVTPDAARNALIRQVSRPVRWEETVRTMMADGVTLFVEIGPGKVLTGLIGRIAKDAARINVQSVGDLDAAREAIAKARAAA